jgi:hypothetical protein
LSSGTRMTSVQVIDMAGRIVEDYSPNTFSMQLDISQLPPQVYLLRINNNVTKRIIKK